jgi:hypothetical protein
LKVGFLVMVLRSLELANITNGTRWLYSTQTLLECHWSHSSPWSFSRKTYLHPENTLGVIGHWSALPVQASSIPHMTMLHHDLQSPRTNYQMYIGINLPTIICLSSS